MNNIYKVNKIHNSYFTNLCTAIYKIKVLTPDTHTQGHTCKTMGKDTLRNNESKPQALCWMVEARREGGQVAVIWWLNTGGDKPIIQSEDRKRLQPTTQQARPSVHLLRKKRGKHPQPLSGGRSHTQNKH